MKTASKNAARAATTINSDSECDASPRKFQRVSSPGAQTNRPTGQAQNHLQRQRDTSRGGIQGNTGPGQPQRRPMNPPRNGSNFRIPKTDSQCQRFSTLRIPKKPDRKKMEVKSKEKPKNGAKPPSSSGAGGAPNMTVKKESVDEEGTKEKPKDDAGAGGTLNVTVKEESVNENIEAGDSVLLSVPKHEEDSLFDEMPELEDCEEEMPQVERDQEMPSSEGHSPTGQDVESPAGQDVDRKLIEDKLQPNTRGLYAVMVPKRMVPEEVEELFGNFGAVQEYSCAERRTFVRFATKEEAVAAVLALRESHKVEVPRERNNPHRLVKSKDVAYQHRSSKPRFSDPMPTRQVGAKAGWKSRNGGGEEVVVFVGNINLKTPEEEVKKLFKNYNVKDCRIMVKDEVKRFGFVTVFGAAEAHRMCADLHETILDGRPLIVQISFSGTHEPSAANKTVIPQEKRHPARRTHRDLDRFCNRAPKGTLRRVSDLDFEENSNVQEVPNLLDMETLPSPVDASYAQARWHMETPPPPAVNASHAPAPWRMKTPPPPAVDASHPQAPWIKKRNQVVRCVLPLPPDNSVVDEMPELDDGFIPDGGFVQEHPEQDDGFIQEPEGGFIPEPEGGFAHEMPELDGGFVQEIPELEEFGDDESQRVLVTIPTSPGADQDEEFMTSAYTDEMSIKTEDEFHVILEGFPHKTHYKTIYSEFKKVGIERMKVDIVSNFAPDPTLAIVTFDCEDSVTKALEWDGKDFNNQPMYIRRLNHKSKSDVDMLNIVLQVRTLRGGHAPTPSGRGVPSPSRGFGGNLRGRGFHHPHNAFHTSRGAPARGHHHQAYHQPGAFPQQSNPRFQRGSSRGRGRGRGGPGYPQHNPHFNDRNDANLPVPTPPAYHGPTEEDLKLSAELQTMLDVCFPEGPLPWISKDLPEEAEVHVSKIISDQHFFGHVTNGFPGVEIKDLTKKMLEKVLLEGAQSYTDPSIKRCAAPYSDSDDPEAEPEYFRGWVTEDTPEGRCRIFFVDWGNDVVVDHKEMLVLTDEQWRMRPQIVLFKTDNTDSLKEQDRHLMRVLNRDAPLVQENYVVPVKVVQRRSSED